MKVPSYSHIECVVEERTGKEAEPVIAPSAETVPPQIQGALWPSFAVVRRKIHKLERLNLTAILWNKMLLRLK